MTDDKPRLYTIAETGAQLIETARRWNKSEGYFHDVDETILRSVIARYEHAITRESEASR